MISNKNIVCFASGWHYHPTSKHHVMRRLSEHNHVIWVNWHASRRPRIRLDDLRTIGSKLLQIQKGPRQVSNNLTVITPPQLPLPGSGLARRINVALVRRAIHRVLSRIPVRPTQFWSFAPDVADLVGSFDEELVLYYCVDAFGEFPGYDRDLIERREKELLAKSDVVLATSEPLYEAKKLLHDNVHFIEHGVDHHHLSRAVTEQLPIPADLAVLPKPVFGFVGVVGEWVDMELMAGLARKRPDASVVVIGPVAGPRGSGSHLPNLHWLGPKDHSELPHYLKGFDVGLIPFRKVPLTYHANPIKLYEYLAAGVPVVSTHLPAVRPVPGSVWLADDVAGTANCCTEATQHNSSEDRLRRSQSMEVESWTARLEQITRIVNEVEARRAMAADPSAVPIAIPVAGPTPMPTFCCRSN